MPRDDADEAAVPEPGLGALIGGGVVAFALITPVAIYLLSFNATQAVLLGGFSGLSAAIAAKLGARRRAARHASDDADERAE